MKLPLMYNLQGCTDVARDDETLLVFSTLGGGLTAVDPITSEIRWIIDDGKPKKCTFTNVSRVCFHAAASFVNTIE